MPVDDYLLVGNCDAGICFPTVKMKLALKKGQKDRLAACI